MVLITVVGQWEWYALLTRAGLVPWRLTGVGTGVLLVVHPLLIGGIRLAVVPLLMLLFWMPFSRRSSVVHAFCATLSGAFYPAVLLSFLIHIRGMDLGFTWVCIVFCLVWVSESSAYAAGRLWGRHKLAPTTSPNKTWEGYFAGVIGPLLAAAALQSFVPEPLGPVWLFPLALICGVASASGDLAESRFKRVVNLSDSGRLLPGHGGVLDRFDGMTVAAPFAYLFLWAIGASG